MPRDEVISSRLGIGSLSVEVGMKGKSESGTKAEARTGKAGTQEKIINSIGAATYIQFTIMLHIKTAIASKRVLLIRQQDLSSIADQQSCHQSSYHTTRYLRICTALNLYGVLVA